MKKRLETLHIERDDLLGIVNEVEKNINISVIPSLKDTAATIKSEDVLTSNILFTDLKLKSDADFFKRLIDICNSYAKILPILKSKINDELPDTFSANTSNINIKLALSLVGEGIFLADNVTDITAYLINKYYTKSGTDLEKSVVSKLGHKLTLLVRLMPELEKAKFNEIVDVIGKVPTIKTIKQESSSIIPMDVVMGFMSNTFKINDKSSKNFIKRALGFFNYKKESKHDLNVAGRSFIGNPIYHIRLFLIDLEQLRFERLKESKRLMELRILELKQKEANNDDPKTKKAIAYYEDKLNKLDMKIERYLRG